MPYVPAADLPDNAVENCDRIAYQYSGIVQPHAALVVVDLHHLDIVQATENTLELLGVPSDTLLNTALTTLGPLGEALTDLSLKAIEAAPKLGPTWTRPDGTRLITRAHRLAERVLVEFEPARHPGDLEPEPLSDLLPTLLNALADAPSTEQAARLTAQIVRDHVHYDRCMVYRFDHDWNGEVIGEARSADAVDSFLGLRFPASDIPASARAMYAKCAVRVTVDQACEGVRLVPLRDPRTNEHTDLTHARSRCNSGVCRNYYLNMGVRSTLVLPVIVGDRPWGHISLHHSSVRRPSPELDRTLNAISKAFADALARVELREHLDAERVAAELQQHLADAATRSPTPKGSFARDINAYLPRVRSLLSGDAIALKLGSEFFTEGADLTEDFADELITAIATRTQAHHFESSRLVFDVPRVANRAAGFAGAMAQRIGDSWDDFLLVLRKERSEDTAWAGDPREGLRWDQNGKPALTPRASFHKYLAATAHSSTRWTTQDRMIAQSCSLMLGLRFLRQQAMLSRRTQAAFLANMSHEIRTPMTAIMGYADVLANDDDVAGDRERFREVIETIRGNAHHLLTVVTDILELGRVKAGELEIERTPTSPLRVADEVATLLKPQASDKQLQLGVRVDTPIPETILSDQKRLRQILVNLVANAIKFTHRGSVDIRLAYDQIDHDLTIAVVDTGIGLAEHQLDAIRRFQPFQQADISTTRRFGGTGLGLSISSELARLLDGTIEVASTPGTGSTFTLKLQLDPIPGVRMLAPDDAAHALASPKDHDERSNGEPQTPLSGLRILLVEDGPDNQKLIAYHLRKAGAEFELAENGRVAIDGIGPDPSDPGFDAILMDMQMPEMDGYDATRWLRERGHTIPIIALTAHAMQGDEQRCLQAGCDAYQTKPIRREQLIRTILKWTRDAAQAPAA